MGITIAQYRCTIGCYNINHVTHAHSAQKLTRYYNIFQLSTFISYKYNYGIVLYYILMLYVFIVIEGLLLNKRNLATRLDDVSSLYKPTQKHYV